MADKKFTLEVVTPRKVMFKREVISFSAPGVRGGFQVLHGHAPFISALEIGELKLTLPDGSEKRYSSSGGFVEVRDDSVVMVAESAEASDEIDVERAEAAANRARQRLSERGSYIDVPRAQSALARAFNRLRVSGRH
jgi:F-type H+-transporting ATPase subunit epsilon